jgi:hypothetical protein
MQALFLPVRFSNLAKSQKRNKTSCDDYDKQPKVRRGNHAGLAASLGDSDYPSQGALETRIIRVKAPDDLICAIPRPCPGTRARVGGSRAGTCRHSEWTRPKPTRETPARSRPVINRCRKMVYRARGVAGTRPNPEESRPGAGPAKSGPEPARE